jgi:hypothetical protein
MGSPSRAALCDGLLDCACDVRGDPVSIVVDAWFAADEWVRLVSACVFAM